MENLRFSGKISENVQIPEIPEIPEIVEIPEIPEIVEIPEIPGFRGIPVFGRFLLLNPTIFWSENAKKYPS